MRIFSLNMIVFEIWHVISSTCLFGIASHGDGHERFYYKVNKRKKWLDLLFNKVQKYDISIEISIQSSSPGSFSFLHIL